jgi:hypothetical protein
MNASRSGHPGRNSRQLTTPQAILGGLAILVVAGGIVTGLTYLLGRGEQTPPLEAPAEPAARPCPTAVDPTRPVTSDQLIECPHTYDRQIVHYRGEAVRAVLRRGDRAWVQLNDDPYALDLGPLPAHRTTVGGNSGIPVSIPVALADQITHVGDARHYGDILDISGIYRRADPADDGGPTIQAHTASIHQPGQPVPRPASRPRLIVAIAVALLAIASTGASRLRPGTGH